MENSIETVVAANELYNNSLTQFMNVQIAVNKGELNKQQATTMLRNIANMMKVQYKGIERMTPSMKWHSFSEAEYKPLFKDLADQMQEYLQTELAPSRSL